MQKFKFIQYFDKPFVRSFGQHNKKHYYKGDEVKYESRIRYYPREHNQPEDPQFPPAKLLKVQRTKPMKGNPFWEKGILKSLKLDKSTHDVAIVKNIPEVNAVLWKIKHLIRIEPIVFPYGEPTENDINYTFLKENGECLVTKKIEIDEQRLEDREKFDKQPVRMTGETLRKELRLRWLNPW